MGAVPAVPLLLAYSLTYLLTDGGRACGASSLEQHGELAIGPGGAGQRPSRPTYLNYVLTNLLTHLLTGGAGQRPSRRGGCRAASPLPTRHLPAWGRLPAAPAGK